MNFTLRQLRIFTVVAEHKSITKAAKELYLSQPAVSIQLKKFQQQFDLPLTELIGKQLYITDFGQQIVNSAHSILAEVDAIEYNSNIFKGRLAGRLRLSIVSTAKYVMPYFLSGFMHLHPEVDLLMDVTNKRQVVADLEKNEADFGMVSVVPTNLDLLHVSLMPNKLYLVGEVAKDGAEHPKTLKSLTKHPLLFREAGSATRDAMEDFLSHKRARAGKKIELTSNEALKQAIIAGLGYSIMPLIGIKNELKNGDLEIVPLPGLPLTTEWDLVWLKSKKLSPVAAAYLEFIRREKDRIAMDKFGWTEQY
ncbi:LysR family transcriptional regulator [Neolewinella antarctica]|uniref:DNA-binding transcriptional LysR family regulator n=1 Tax=Neolewinella antarctica TaxID=442734 RepID=A0ABX0XAE6_9BACT|nr:LysR family transcriptional regulator [Neolewinella antarctica]NJC26228.1 DNA-binding transcriptional LysR family regulator [Neolewinella antarctica]